MSRVSVDAVTFEAYSYMLPDYVRKALDPQPIGWQPIADMPEEMKDGRWLALMNENGSSFARYIYGSSGGKEWVESCTGKVFHAPEYFAHLGPAPTEGGE